MHCRLHKVSDAHSALGPPARAPLSWAAFLRRRLGASDASLAVGCWRLRRLLQVAGHCGQPPKSLQRLWARPIGTHAADFHLNLCAGGY